MGYHEYVHGAYYGLKYQASQKRYLVTVLGLRLLYPIGNIFIYLTTVIIVIQLGVAYSTQLSQIYRARALVMFS